MKRDWTHAPSRCPCGSTHSGKDRSARTRLRSRRRPRHTSRNRSVCPSCAHPVSSLMACASAASSASTQPTKIAPRRAPPTHSCVPELRSLRADVHDIVSGRKTMYGISTSITFLLPHAEAAALVQRSKSGDLVSMLPAKDDRSLVATSRNNQMEYALRALMKAFPSDGLSYLRRWDEVHDKPPWITAIRGA